MLKATALLAVLECTHYSHDIGPARKEVAYMPEVRDGTTSPEQSHPATVIYSWSSHCIYPRDNHERAMDLSVQSYRNRLLELLDPKDLDRLRPHLKPTIFDYRQSLYEANSPIPSVYFPIDGVASLVNTMANGSAAEVGTIGNEGIVGLPVIFGDRYAPTSAYIQCRVLDYVCKQTC